MTIDPAFNVPCPTCHVKAGQPCRSRRAITIHQARREALADLSVQAGQLLAASRQKPEPRKPAVPPKPVLMGKTGGPVVDDNEDWPPWEAGPVSGCVAESKAGVGGLVWCLVHRRHEELHVAT